MFDEDEGELPDDNIIPTNKIVAESSDQLEKEFDKFRQDWKKELLEEKNEDPKIQNKTEIQHSKGKNVAQYHSFSQRPKLATKPGELNSGVTNTYNDLDYQEPTSNEQKSQYLFEKGVLLEQQGRHYEGSLKFL